ncbi:MAG: nitroreductase family protein [Synergistaceae bacterium]|jgi:nitroreductase|nr:nitroreductase family protein [Synergistaceae bacterium]
MKRSTTALFLIAFIAAVIIAGISATEAHADKKLPAPQTSGGMGLFEALKKRQSAPGGDFPTADLSDAELANALWAATGLNRGENGWTVPMDRGLPPYVDVYAALPSGVFRYDWKAHSLLDVSKKDIRPNIGLQNFVAQAPCSLIFVANSESLSAIKNETLMLQFSAVAAGAMTQDVYLAAAAMGLGARYIHSIKEAEIKRELALNDADSVICLMLLGK